MSSACNHRLSNFGICLDCGAVKSLEMWEEIKLFIKKDPKTCLACESSIPTDIFRGKPIDWVCKKHDKFPCAIIAGKKGYECKDWKERVVLCVPK